MIPVALDTKRDNLYQPNNINLHDELVWMYGFHLQASCADDWSESVYVSKFGQTTLRWPEANQQFKKS